MTIAELESACDTLRAELKAKLAELTTEGRTRDREIELLGFHEEVLHLQIHQFNHHFFGGPSLGSPLQAQARRIFRGSESFPPE